MGIRGFYWKVSDFLKVTNLKPFNIVASRDGKLYEIRDHEFLGRLVTHKKDIRELDMVKPGFEFRLPKIPSEVLTSTLSLFQTFIDVTCKDYEVMVQLFWDTKENCYLLECPYQMVTKTRIHVQDYPILHSQRYVQVMQIHSHNTMSAFFSSIDDQDEKAFMLYGVVGELNNVTAAMKVRVGCNGEFIELPLDYIFEKVDLSSNGSFPNHWPGRVTLL